MERRVEAKTRRCHRAPFQSQYRTMSRQVASIEVCSTKRLEKSQTDVLGCMKLGYKMHDTVDMRGILQCERQRNRPAHRPAVWANKGCAFTYSLRKGMTEHGLNIIIGGIWLASAESVREYIWRLKM